MKKDVLYYLGSNILKMVVSILVMLPLTTYYLSVEEIGLFAFLMLLSNLIMVPLNTGGNLIINAYYFTSSELNKKELIFHLYLYELVLKIAILILVIIFGDAMLSITLKNYSEDITFLFQILCVSLVFSATRGLFYHILTAQKASRKFFFYNCVEILFVIIYAVLLLAFFNLGLLGYVVATLLASITMFTVEIKAIWNDRFLVFEKRWSKIIYTKGIRLFYGNLIEQFVNVYDSFVIQKTLDMYQLGIYSHAKQYVTKFGALDKAFFQAYSVLYIQMLNGEKKLNILKISAFWYAFLLICGIGIIYFADTVISMLTHDKLTESAPLVAILYTLVFFRSNLQQYSCQILYDKRSEIFILLATFANILGMVVLSLGVFVYDLGLYFVAASFVLIVLFKNLFIKLYAIICYRIIDVSEFFFICSVSIYILLLKVNNVF